MKTNFLIFLAPIISLILFYLITSFVIWDINASNWGYGGRAFMALFGIPISLFVSLVVNDKVKTKNK